MDQHRGHAERVGDQTGVLAASPAEAVERVASNVIAALPIFLDRVRRVLDHDLDKAVGDLLAPRPTFSASSAKASPPPGRRVSCCVGGSLERTPARACRPSHWRR